MADAEKRIVLDEHGLDTLLLKIFRVIEDTYMRRTEFPTNPLENISFEIRDDGCLYLIYDEAAIIDHHTYGFELDMDESEPDHMITYIGDNEFYTPAHMDFNRSRFSYGSWSNAFFIKNLKVVMLTNTGEVDYEINPNDYTKKLDGTPSDVGDPSYPGNVMIGIPRVWIKVDTSVERYPRFYFASTKLDNDYHAYAHTDANGHEADYIYVSAYEGYKYNNVMRSISGVSPTRDEVATDQITECRANGSNWDMGAFSEHNLITLLLMLIGKSTNSQAVFGFGNGNGGSNPTTGADSNGILPTGSMNDKGLFWGSSANNLGVKVFGIENFWGNVWKRTQGLINDNGTMKYKLTKGTADGSSASDYSATGTGYLTAGLLTDIHSGNFITDMYVGNFGLLPKASSGTTGSDTLYYCDKVWVNNSQVNFAQFGATASSGSGCGATACHLYNAVSSHNTNIGVFISYKPTE